MWKLKQGSKITVFRPLFGGVKMNDNFEKKSWFFGVSGEKCISKLFFFKDFFNAFPAEKFPDLRAQLYCSDTFVDIAYGGCIPK